MDYLRCKGWKERQGYKDGRPIHWIKLHIALLEDYNFSKLSEIQQSHIVKIWALAGKTENKLPNDAEWIGQRISAQSEVDLKQLVTLGFLAPYVPVLDRTNANAKPYLEERREEDIKRVEKKEPRARKSRLPSDWKMSAEQRAYCKKKRPDLNPDQVEENFKDYWLGAGTTKLDWNRVWQTWVRKEQAQKGNGALPKDLPALEAYAKKHRLPAARPGESLWEWRSRLEATG